METTLDGNAAAGALSELFAFDATMAMTTCATCGDRRRVAELQAYMDAPGLVMRCTTCNATQLRLVRAPDRAWLDLRGIQALEIHSPTIDT